MNPLTNVKNIAKLGQQELDGNLKTSWHEQYKDSAWVFIGGLPYNLTEGDVVAVFSQYGKIVNINLVRDKLTGKQKGYGFLCYEDQRSTILAVDNFNGIKGEQFESTMLRTIRFLKYQKRSLVNKEGLTDDDHTWNTIWIEMWFRDITYS